MRDMGIIGNMPGYFEYVETTRPYDGYWHSVRNVVTIVLLGSLCGLRNLPMIREWAAGERVTEYLQKMGIPRVPSYSHMMVVLGLIEPVSLGLAMESWIVKVVSAVGKTIAMDGKTERSTEKMGTYESAVHIVSAHMSELGLTIGTEAVAGKSNEMCNERERQFTCSSHQSIKPAVRELIKRLDLKDALIVADALNCQKDTAEAIVEAGADYLLEVKNNQPNLCDGISELFAVDERMDLIENDKAAIELDKHGGRKEYRAAYVRHDVEKLMTGHEWPGLACMGAINRQVEANNVTSDEWHYYISSREMGPEELLRHARLEWGVESMHWLLDVHFWEDKMRLYNENSVKNLNIIHNV